MIEERIRRIKMEAVEEFDFSEENQMKIRKRLKEREKDSEKDLKKRKTVSARYKKAG